MIKTHRIIVAGTRHENNKDSVYAFLDHYTKDLDNDLVVIVCGCCPDSPDVFADEWAKDKGVDVDYFPADWDKHKSIAGAIRNRKMALNATHLIAFWDGVSTGTKNMIQEAYKEKLIYKVIPTTWRNT